MPAAANSQKTELAKELAELQSGTVRRAGAAEIVDVVNTIIESMNRDIPANDVAVRDNLEDLADYIRDTKADIMQLRPDEISDEHLPSATIELDAIIIATENATNEIMEAAEQIETVAGAIDGEKSDTLSAATTRIYEACSFQDITGQRVSKVVTALRNIESKIDDLIGVFGEESEEDTEARRRRREEERERLRQEAVASGDLREGPQLPDEAVGQDDIDALFDSL